MSLRDQSVWVGARVFHPDDASKMGTITWIAAGRATVRWDDGSLGNHVLGVLVPA